MYRSSALCTENPLQPECFSGRLSGSGKPKMQPAKAAPKMHYSTANVPAPRPLPRQMPKKTMYPQARAANDPLLKKLSSPMFSSGARATEHMNGSVLYSTLNDYAADPDFPSETLQGDGVCFDCSTVDEATFMTKCVRDSNVGAATLRLAPCSVKANRDVNQDQGSRQPERVSTRENTIFNLTDAKYAASGSVSGFNTNNQYTSPLLAAAAATKTMLTHTGAPLQGFAQKDNILGAMTPAFAVSNVGLVSKKL